MLILSAALAYAGTLAGVTLPDTATVGGQTVSLNGLGLREKYFLDIYVGGLYLTQKTHDGNAAINADAPKRVVMHFIYSKVTKDQVVETFMEGFGSAATGPQKANVEALLAKVPMEIHAGEEVGFDYAPGTGTTFVVNGKPAITIPGTDFMKLVWGIYLGPKPPTPELKAGMLGG